MHAGWIGFGTAMNHPENSALPRVRRRSLADIRAIRSVDRFTHCPFARSDANGGAAHLERMTTMRSWQEMVNEAIEAPTLAAANGRVSADVLARAALGRRVADAHTSTLDAAR